MNIYDQKRLECFSRPQRSIAEVNTIDLLEKCEE